MDMSAALATFIDESRELLEQMERILLAAESGDVTSDDLHALFRCAHTIKGSAGLFALDAIVHFTHDVENVLDDLRNGEIGFSPELAAMLLEAGDHISLMVAVAEENPAGDFPENAELSARIAAAGAVGQKTGVAAHGAGEQQGVPQVEGQWHLSIRFGRNLLREGMDPLAFINHLRTIGELVVVETVTTALPSLRDADPEACYLGFELSLRSDAPRSEIEQVFEFVEGDADIRIIEPGADADAFAALITREGEVAATLVEHVLACGCITRGALDAVLKTGSPESKADAVTPVSAAAPKTSRRDGERRLGAESRSVKIPADRLDTLIDQVGELVIAGAATQLQAQKIKDSELQETASHLLRLVEEVRDSALRLRMAPIGEVFSRFPRVVRDVARELGKEIDLRILGSEAELDKSMVDKVGDPLMHLVRNAIDHGIETPEQREAAGKPQAGRVQLNAYHESGCIVIEISDDGRGLDHERILAKAVERGLVRDDSQLSIADIHRLILEPGFSTADAVTELSGRGVGMDVVKRGVEALRGTLDIESTLGEGTKIRLCLPLTLAIIDGFQVEAGDAAFILPLDAVVECIELPQRQRDADYLNLREQVLPILRLRAMFDMDGEAPARQNVVVVRSGSHLAGIVVDRLAGECQTVIKPLGRLFERVAGLTGSTIMGNGEVALILDVAQLVQLAIASETTFG